MNEGENNGKKVIISAIKKTVKPIITILVIVSIIVGLLASSLYFLTIDDGTYKEGDWTSTPYAASQYTNNINMGNDGVLANSITAQELWDKMIEEGNRVDLYLDSPEELLKLMNAQVVTQFLDTRSNPDAPIDWDKINDINSKELQGIIKLKRAKENDKTSTMTYVDPETFQSYIDDYNSSGSEKDKEKALSHFTLERATSYSNTTEGALQTIDGVNMEILTDNGKVTFYNGDGSAVEGGSNDRFGQPLADGKVAAKGLAPDRSVIYIQTQESGEGSFANGKFFYICDTGGGLASNQIDVYAKVSQSQMNAEPYGTYNGAKISLVEKNVTWEQYLSKYHNKTLSNLSENKSDSEEENNSSNNIDAMCWPTDGTRITSEFGLRNSSDSRVSRDHRGMDIGVAEGTNVYACESGTVTTAGMSGTAGNLVVIDHGNGYVSKYMHNSKIEVSVGQNVQKGQVIAKSGNTGNSTGPHLHFQIEFNGQAIDPLTFKYNNGMGGGTRRYWKQYKCFIINENNI